MKVTLVTEHTIIIGTLQAARILSNPVAPTYMHEIEAPDLDHVCADPDNPYCGPSTAFNPLQSADEPLGTPPTAKPIATGPLPYHDDYCTCDECMAAMADAQAAKPAAHATRTLAVPPETLPPCAEGNALSLVLMVTNVVKRNA